MYTTAQMDNNYKLVTSFVANHAASTEYGSCSTEYPTLMPSSNTTVIRLLIHLYFDTSDVTAVDFMCTLYLE